MMTHQITVRELDEYKAAQATQWVRFAGSFGRGIHKTLDYNVDGLYRVCKADRSIYTGPSKEIAVREYNELN